MTTDQDAVRAELSSLLDHGAADRTVESTVVQRQLDTAAALRQRIDQHGGVILGDEVGAGKTFVAMALLVYALAHNPDRGAVILVPTAPLLGKWEADLRLYLSAAVRDSELRKRLLNSISVANRGLPRKRRNAIVVGVHNLFMGQIRGADYAAVLCSYLTHRSDRRRRHFLPWLRECGFAGWEGPPPDWTVSPWAKDEVFAQRPALLAPLDRVFQAYEQRASVHEGDVRWAVQEVRRRVARAHLPDTSLLVIDEAHHLRHTTTTRYRTMLQVMAARFDGLLFLTATPFQMEPRELRNVIDFSRSARLDGTSAQERGEREHTFTSRLAVMTAAMEEHVVTLEAFGRAWADLNESEARQCQAFVEGEGSVDYVSPQVAHAGELFLRSLETKADVETALAPFLIRSLHEHHRTVRSGSLSRNGAIPSSSRIPLALTDRMLYEVFEQRDRTFIASVLLGACSSWEALFTSAVMLRDSAAGRRSRQALWALHPRLLGPHPKVDSTISAALDAVRSREKILIFVERTETGRELQRRIRLELARADETSEEAERGRRAFQDRDRLAWPALRENYLYSVYPLVFRDLPDPARIETLAEQHLELFQHLDSAAPPSKRDYSLEKRYWEHIYFRSAVERLPGWEQTAGDRALIETVKRILHPDYPLNGLDLVSGRTGNPRQAPEGAGTDRSPQLEFAAAFLRYRSPWARHAELLAPVAPDYRAELVDAAAATIARSHLRIDFIRLDLEGAAGPALDGVEELLGRPEWQYRFQSLAEQLVLASRGIRDPSDELDPAAQRVRRLLDGLSSRNRVQYIDGSTDDVTLRNTLHGFNTPMYPDVLIATDVLGEGVDLQRHCRHVIHHDLPWNPAKLEQRTGRVDRIGSLCDHLRESDPTITIQVDMPYVAGTYDSFIYSQVTNRERIFRWLLGNRPEWEMDAMNRDEPPQPVPEEWADRLRIDLSPSRTALT